MKPIILPFVPAAAILAAGIILLAYQRSEIAGLEDRARGSSAEGKTTAKISGAAARPPATGSNALPAPTVRTDPAGDAAAAIFLTGLQDEARPLIEKAVREAAAGRARHLAGRAGLLLGLSADEVASLRQFIESRQDVNSTSAARQWIVEQRGIETAAKFDASESARRAAASEHDAQDAIFRLSRIVDLTPEQKDRLYAAFVRRAAAAAPDENTPFELKTAFSLTDTPAIENPWALARSVLTAEQLAFFDAAQAQERQAIADASQGVMSRLMPAVMTALQQAAAGQEPQPAK